MDENDDEPDMDPGNNLVQNEEITETILLKMASMQALSCEVIKEFMNDTCLYKADSDILDVSNLIIKEALADILANIDDVEIKAKSFKPHFNILAMLNVGFTRRTFMDAPPSTLIPIKSSVIPSSSSSKPFEYRPLFQDLDSNNFEETPIHESLREMGFDSGLISEALRYVF